MSTTPTRVGAGLRTGGEFTRHAHAPADITLDGPDGRPEPAVGPGEDSASPAHVAGMSNQEIPVTAVELAYAEGTSDKFYRVFSINESVLTCQYGRAGTYGTFTPRKAATDPAAAAKAADKAVAGKSAKGYQIVRSGAGKFDHIPTDSELDSMLNTMPAGANPEVSTPQLREQSAVTAAANTADVDATVLPRVTTALAASFGPGRSTSGTGTVVPMLAQVATKAEAAYMLTSPHWVSQPKCISPMTQILTDDGWSAARYIQVGQSVLTSDGTFHEVQEVHRSPRAGRKMVTIKPWGAQPYDVTTDHKILTACGWKSASALTLDDRLVTPRPKLSKSLVVNSVHLNAGSGYVKTVECDDEFAWFCGFWMGDGSAQAHHNGKTSGRVSLAVNGDHLHIVSRLLDFIKIRLGCEPHVYIHPEVNLKQVYFTDMPFARWLTENFRHQLDDNHADHSPAGKTLPLWMDSWDRARFTEFLNGYFEADGCRVTDSRYKRSVQRKAATVSPHIAGRLYRLLLAHGIPAAIVLGKTTWTYEGVKKSGTAWFFDLLRSDRGMRLVGDNWHVRIRSIEPVTRPPVTVMDLTVDGIHDFMAGTIVHNCDGDRVMVVVEDGVVSVFNRSGQPKVKNVGEAHLAPFRGLNQGRWAFDGELVGRTLHLFDMPAAGGYASERGGFDSRYQALKTTLAALDTDTADIALVATATGEQAKRDMLQSAKDGRKEGVIFRDAHAPYRSGRTDVLRKFKLYNEIDAYVVEVNKGGKENAVLAVRDANGKEVVVGQVSTIGKGKITVGQVLEVKFLYTVSEEKPVLYQPTIMRVRNDEKSAQDCSVEQLRGSVTDRSVS